MKQIITDNKFNVYLSQCFKAPTIFATRQDIRLPSVAAHRKVNHDLRKALNHVMSDSVKNAAKGQGMNMVTFEEDEKEVEGKVGGLVHRKKQLVKLTNS